MFSVGGFCESPEPDQDDSLSDCESGVSGPGPDQSRPPSLPSDNGLIRVHDGDRVYRAIETKLVSSFSARGVAVRVEAVRRFDYASDQTMTRARIRSFVIYSRAVGIKCGGDGDGNGNVKFGWFGASKEEISSIFSNGFGVPKNDGTHGLGVYLTPVDHPAESLLTAKPDDEGLLHVLMCRVILGKTEVVHPGSDQDNPSSLEFDSGVDCLESPRKYIVWTSRMNTHILPEFVVSFRSCNGGVRRKEPSSNWMPLRNLIDVLSKHLPSDAFELIKKHHDDFKKQKISRFEMIQRARHIAGDELLMEILKSFRGKVRTSRASFVQT